MVQSLEVVVINMNIRATALNIHRNPKESLMPKPIVSLISETTSDLRNGRESWRVLSFFWACAAVITVLVQHMV